MGTVSNQANEQKINIGLVIFRTALFVFGVPALVLLLAGTIRWWQFWADWLVTVVGSIIGRLIMARVNPGLVRERASYDSKADVKPWDRVLMPLVALILPTLTLIVAGLDKRFGWSIAPALWMQIAALVLLILGTLLAHWATISNRFFAAVVRIQTDRGHTVVDTGPYRFVRHPGYAGGVLSAIAVPLLLGSYWAFIPSALHLIILVIRTALEDRTLRDELPGYEEYTQRTRYRLLPPIW
ncbi:MAG: isoprenylcysteine carboxylmethyltransferase family protein [Anaerolineae bacterium]|nr:isoprenylcysteine carboxylmethyltransferase family protein [Anaerolineae bacterium]